MIGAFGLISKSRRYITGYSGVSIPLSLSLQDIQGYFDVFGCDLDKGLFIECIFALDQVVLDKVNKK